MTDTTLDPCPELIAQLGARAVGALEPEAAERLEAHLAAGCAGCAGLLADLEAELDAARLPEEDPAPGGWERVLVRLDGAAPRAEAPAPVVRLRCAYCHDDLRRAEAACCAACLAPHHPDCFLEHGRCAAPGCQETRTLRAGEPAPAASATPPRPARHGRGPRGALLVLGLLGGGVGVAAWSELGRRAELAEAQALQGEAQSLAQQQVQLDWSKALIASGDVQTTPSEPNYGGKPLSHWIDVLGDHSPQFRDQASQAIVAMGELAWPALLAASQDPSDQRRLGVLETILYLDHPDHDPLPTALVQLVLRALSDPAAPVRKQAALVLSSLLDQLGPARQEALEALIERVAADPEPISRLEACNTLSQLLEGSPPAQAALARVLERDPSPQVRLAVVHPLTGVAPATTGTVSALIHAVGQDQDLDVRLAAAEGLGELELVPELVGRVAGALSAAMRQDPQRDVQERAAASLASLPGEALDLDALLAAAVELSTPRRVLSRQRPQALARLLHDLAGRSEAEQRMALEVLSGTKLEGSEAAAALVPVLTAYVPRGATPALRVRSAYILWRLARPDSARDEDEAEGRAAPREEALAAVERIVPDLVAQLEEAPAAHQVALAAWLGQRSASAAPALRALAGDQEQEYDLRARALGALIRVAPADARTVTTLGEVLREQDLRAYLREECLRAVARLGPRAAPLAADVAAQLRRDVDHGGRGLALDALTAMQLTPSALAPLKDQLTITANSDPVADFCAKAQLLLDRLERADAGARPGPAATGEGE